MSEKRQRPESTLLEDLEEIRSSLVKITPVKPDIPTLEEIVGHRPPTAVNPNNPFLSSESLTELLKIRNEAESRAAEELASMAPVRSLEEILQQPSAPELQMPDPEQILSQMEQMFDSWIENAVEQYLTLFEHELRHRLQQDLRDLVGRWYQDQGLPLPESFNPPNDQAED